MLYLFYMTSKEKKLQKQIITLLKAKHLYEPSDDLLIDEIHFLQGIIAQAKTEINTNGIMVNVRSDPGKPMCLQTNQSVSIYRDALKSLITLCTKLGITPQERSKLKLIDNQKDGFDLNKFLNDN